MSFTSAVFALFLPAAFILYWGLPERFSAWALLLLNVIFYAFAGPVYLIFLVYETLLSYAAGRRIAGETEGKRSACGLFIAALLAPLVIYKALGFMDRGILIPVGLSFYTFQAVGYLADIRSGRFGGSASLREHALFMTFFPQLLAGPIPRGEKLAGQFAARAPFSYDLAAAGLRRFLWGLFKKLTVADLFAALIAGVFAHPENYRGFILVLAAVFFSFQIYCDFSAYSDMAIGTAALFGIRLEENFRRPYLADSVRDFWSRWHISLSEWFRDRVYIPLGGNRRGRARSDCNLLVTMLVSGLWHGSGPTFLLWGLLHGLLQLIERHLPQRGKQPENRAIHGFLKGIRVIFVFCLVTAAWIFFRADSVSGALAFFRYGFTGITHPVSYLRDGIGAYQEKKTTLVLLAVVIGTDLASEYGRPVEWFRKLPAGVRMAATVAFLLFFWFMLPDVRTSQFLYFSF